MLSENGGGPPSKMYGLGSKIHLKSPLAPQPVSLKLDSMPPSKGPFFANIHLIIPKLSLPIPQDMCFLKMVGGALRKCTRMGQKSTSNHHKDSGWLLTTPLKELFRGNFSTNMHLIIPNFAVRISQGMCFRKRYGFSIRKCTGIGKNNVWNHP